jgi:hypothetical protein
MHLVMLQSYEKMRAIHDSRDRYITNGQDQVML